MPRLILALLLLCFGGVATWLAVDHNAFVVLRELLTQAGRWLLLNVPPLAKLYATRRALAPLWNNVYKIVFVVLGTFGLQRLTRKLQKYLMGHASRAWAAWKKLPKWWRWAISGIAIFCIGFFGFGIILLPLWIPGLGKFMRGFYFKGVDSLTNKWTRPVRSWYRRFVRQNTIARVIRRPYRILLYHAVTRSERGSRWAHRHVHRILTREKNNKEAPI